MGINPKIIKEINKKCETDKRMKKLLLDLLELEIEGKGRWKDPYKDAILKYCDEKESVNEN